MKMKTTRSIAALIFCAYASFAIAQTYTGLTWGLDRTSDPYKIGINLNGVWYNFGKISSTGYVTLYGNTYTGFMWPDQDSGVVNSLRFGGRVFLGGAADNFSDNFTGVDTLGSVPRWVSREAQVLAWNQKGRIAFSGVSRVSDADSYTSLPAAAIGVSGFGLSDSVLGLSGHDAWGGYFESSRTVGSTNAAFGAEIDAGNDGADHTNTPYSLFGSGVFGLNIAAGGSKGTAYANPSTAAIIIANNTQSFNSGIIFGATSITGTNGLTGFGYAIEMARGHILEWDASDGTGDGAYLTSTVSNTNNRVDIVFSNDAITYDNAGRTLSKMEGVASAVNYLRLINMSTGAAPEIRSAGSDTNVDLGLRGQGSGAVSTYSLLLTLASSTSSAGIRVPHGAAPTSPVNGDVWSTTSAFFARVNGATITFADLESAQTISGVKTFSSAPKLPAYTVAGLPTCNAGAQNSIAVVTDATAPTYNAALTGGGAVRTLAFCDGSAWTSH